MWVEVRRLAGGRLEPPDSDHEQHVAGRECRHRSDTKHISTVNKQLFDTIEERTDLVEIGGFVG